MRLWFFSRPFHENFKFLKNCPYDIHEILHSHSTHKGAPACAKASKWYGWDLRNIAKISTKMAKKQPFFDFFFDFLTNCSNDSNESESEGKRLKPTPLPHMRLWFSFFLGAMCENSDLGSLLDLLQIVNPSLQFLF